MKHPSIQLSKAEDIASHSVILSDLVNMEDPQNVLDEVKATLNMMIPEFDFEPIDTVYRDIIKLFSGKYPGYKKCNTEYHDLRHTMDTFLAMARLIHGAYVRGLVLNSKDVTMGLISALMHDTGYIQHIDDRIGTGGKYTLVHINRSIEFMKKYFTERGYSREDFRICRDALLCTGLHTKTNKIRFATKENKLMAKMLGTSDLLGQMADRTYLEKLLFLFLEMQEANIQDFDDEFDLLKKTLEFYELTKDRFADEMDGVNSFMRDHFKTRWNIDKDLYLEAVENQMKYLKSILENHAENYRSKLRRGGLVKKMNKRKVKLHNNKP